MIRLFKRDLPAHVASRLARRKERYEAVSAQGQAIPDSLASSYNDPDVKAFLKQETSDKCAYCESKVPHVAHGDIEHILSKRHRPDLRFDYSNLTFSCLICNNKKRDYHDDRMPLLNPFLEEPSDHLGAYGPMVMRLHTSDRGFVTQRVLDLNRAELIERRTERLEQVGALIDQLSRENSPSVKAVLEEQIRQECGGDKEYSFVTRSYVQSVQGD